MEPTENQIKLFFEFCEYLDQDSQYTYEYSNISIPNRICIDAITLSTYYISHYYMFKLSKYNLTDGVFLRKYHKNTIIRKEFTDIFNVFLRKKKIKKLQKNGTN